MLQIINSNNKKHFKNKFSFLFLTLVIAIALAGCSKEYTIDVPITYGITTWESNSSDDLAKVQNYIATLNLPEKPVIFTGNGKTKSAAISDAKTRAKRESDLWIAKFKDSDIEALGLDESTRFIWSVSSDGVVFNEFCWKIQIIF